MDDTTLGLAPEQPPLEEVPLPEPQNPEPIQDPNVLPEDVERALNALIDNFDKEEQPTRDRMVRFWKKCELFWKGLQNIYWDSSYNDYRQLSSPYSTESEPNEELDYYYQDKIINIFRAHGESIVSALSQEVPTVIFPPDDADNIDDVQTAKGYTKAAELLQKCNDTDLMMIYCIYILWNQGLVAAHNYNVADFEFGSYVEPIFEDEAHTETDTVCPNCGSNLGMVIDDETPVPQVCPGCEQEVMPMPMDSRQNITKVQSGEIEKPKQREKIDLYGPLSVKIPHYVTNPKHSPYVRLDTECHIDYARSLFEDIDIADEHDLEKYDRWARTSTDYAGELPLSLVTLSRIWIRDWVYNHFKKNEPEVYTYLTTNFPNGCKVTRVNEKIVRVDDETIDEHWTFTQSPLSSHLHSDPLGTSLIPVQEMRNELVILKLQTVEYGIPETFADPQVLDFTQYKKTETSPGQIYPAKALPGMGLEAGFATLKTATFPKEANDFQQELDSDGQFVTGAFPSIYGGSMPSASKTAAEYQMSRNQALQRLQISWKILARFWAKVMDKSTRSFISNLKRDEVFPEKQGKSYINVYIRQAELQGRVGSAEPELASTFPMSWMQKRDVLMQLLQLGNDYVNQALFDPANTSLLAEYLGFRDFYIPGDDARTKQLLEIRELLGAEPIEGEMPDMQTGQPQLNPTVQIDPEMDEHQYEYDTCVKWMNSEIGLEQKQNNPGGYMNVRAHALQHLQIIQMQQMMQQEQEQQQQSPKEGSNNGKSSNEQV